MIINLLWLVLGLALLVKGAGWLVDGASALAKKFRISDLAIGLTIVAFGTSAPELVVNTYASAQSHQGIVFGNIIGSNIFNLFAILGLAGLIIPLRVQSSTVWKEIPLSLLAVFILFLLVNDGWLAVADPQILTGIDGLILLVFFVGFLFYVYYQLRREPVNTLVLSSPISNAKMLFLVVGGLTGLVLGGKMVVSNAVDIATLLNVSEKIIGLTIVAAGTSLPELATSVVAAYKKNDDIAVGNVIGSNIFNIFLILSVSAFIKPLEYENDFNIHLYFLSAGTAFLFISMFIGRRRRLDRWQAGILLISYLIFTACLIYFM